MYLEMAFGTSGHAISVAISLNNLCPRGVVPMSLNSPWRTWKSRQATSAFRSKADTGIRAASAANDPKRTWAAVTHNSRPTVL
jgi:hypothetical protein